MIKLAVLNQKYVNRINVPSPAKVLLGLKNCGRDDPEFPVFRGFRDNENALRQRLPHSSTTSEREERKYLKIADEDP